MIKTVFIVGNKRSGSTQLMRLLNLHPRIFISNESDIIWILYRFHQGLEIIPYRWDSPLGMSTTLKICGHLLSKDKTPLENFVTIQTYLMENGFLKVKPMHKTELMWIGDQKPFQQIDPKVIPFIQQNFPDTKYIHLIRHPFPVIRSSKIFVGEGGDGGPIWRGMNDQELLERWTMHESWVKQEKANPTFPMLDVKYEDIVEHTESEMRKILQFLTLDDDQDLLKTARQSTERLLKLHPRLVCSPETQAIMAEYGYQTTSRLLENELYVKIINKFRKIKHKLTGTW